MQSTLVDRRFFLRVTSTAAGGVLVSLYVRPAAQVLAQANAAAPAPGSLPLSNHGYRWA